MRAGVVSIAVSILNRVPEGAWANANVAISAIAATTHGLCMFFLV
jgi:hypothetical protein